MIRLLINLLLFSVSIQFLHSQNATNSPGSMYGIGDITSGEYGKYAGMGGVGIGMRPSNSLNYINPSGLTALDSARLVYEVGGMLGVEKYSLSGKKNTSFLGNITNLSLGGRIIPKWYAAIGVVPLSSVGYATTIDQEIEGTNSTTSSLFEGNGGLYKINLANAIKLNKQFSIGANIAYVLGNIEHTETQGSATISENTFMKAFYADFGFQYIFSLKPNLNLTVGGVYGLKQLISQDNDLIVSSSSGGEGISSSFKIAKKYLPQNFGGGLTLTGHKWSVSSEYKFLQWSVMESDYSTVSYTDQHRLNMGVELLSGNIWRNPWRWMFGGSVYNSYVKIKNHSTMNYAVTLGAGIPVLEKSLLSTGIRYEWQNNNGSSQRENSIMFYLNISWSEKIWKAKIQ